MTGEPVVSPAPVSPVDVARLEGLALESCDQAWTVREGGPTSVFVAALTNAAPSLLAAYRAVERVEAALPTILVEITASRHGLGCSMRPWIYEGARCNCDLNGQIRAAVESKLRAALDGAE